MSSSSATGHGLAGRYANALISLADDKNALDVVADDLRALRTMIDDSADLRRLITSPVLTREDQQRAIAALLEKAKFHDLTRRFAGLVAHNRRLFALPKIIAACLQMIAERHGELTAHVVAAQELTASQSEALTEALRKAVGSKIAIDLHVDENLLGGLIVKVGSRMVDSSLNTKLSQLRLALKGA